MSDMYLANIKPESTLSQTKTQSQTYRRQYPHFRTVRIRHTNLEKIKGRSVRYGESVDDILTRLLEQLEYYERLGYSTPQEEGSF